jgi:hypothetical protein
LISKIIKKKKTFIKFNLIFFLVAEFVHFVPASLQCHTFLHRAFQGMQILQTFSGDKVTAAQKHVLNSRGAFFVFVLWETGLRAIVFNLSARHRLSANDGAKRVWFFNH